ncbi:hypothetical protein GCM10018793_23550 [Streptomyces sulfonofaciens]|uniref:O-acyltransferase WSD1 C-terminal domain-containing protein n=2 Tax=Streptomyces sulfonofaciens TaxID=68272 RepID=A0A919KYI9_9ACTN|nr:hypothetical protein GCM10018793_23550 [Streptomyces sulfonofaciens]
MQAVSGVPCTIGLVAVFAGDPPGLAEVRARVAERWGALPRMNVTLQPPAAGFPAVRRHRWASGAGPFDPVVHVADAACSLDVLLADGAVRPFPDGLPRWRLHLVREAPFGGDFALVLMADHTALDGRSVVTLMRLLMDEEIGARRGLPEAHRPPVRGGDVWREFRDMLRRGQAVPCPAPDGTHPDLALTAVPPEVVRAARRLPATGPGATLTELLVGSVAGALRARYGPPSNWPGGTAPVYGSLPVDLRTPERAHDLGNLVSVVRVPLPIGLADPAARLLACQRTTATVPARRQTHRALAAALQALGRPGPWAARALAPRFRSPLLSPVLCNAFKFPGHPCALHGRALTRVGGVNFGSPGTACFSLIQTGGAFTLTTAAQLRPGDAGLLAAAVGRELEAFARRAPRRCEERPPGAGAEHGDPRRTT